MFLLFFTLRYFHYEPPAPVRHRHFSLRPFPPTAVKTAGNARLMASVCLSGIIFAIVTAKNSYFSPLYRTILCRGFFRAAVFLATSLLRPLETVRHAGGRFRPVLSALRRPVPHPHPSATLHPPRSPNKCFSDPEPQFRGYPVLSFEKENCPFIFGRITETFP